MMYKISRLLILTFQKPLFSNATITKMQAAGLNYYYPKEEIDRSEWPEVRKLQTFDKQPQERYRTKMFKMRKLMRGPEPVHTELIYKSYGIKALLGGRMKHQHFETVRNVINKKIDIDRMFAIWRIDAPWQPLSKKSIGKRMGLGKGSVHHYCTPVKADRIILELGGDISRLEANKILVTAAEILPFPARVVSHADLQREKNYEIWVDKNNKNPYTMEYVIQNNMGGCNKGLSKYDFIWYGRYK